eukprot:2004238-Prymnesium_polylepis.1
MVDDSTMLSGGFERKRDGRAASTAVLRTSIGARLRWSRAQCSPLKPGPPAAPSAHRVTSSPSFGNRPPWCAGCGSQIGKSVLAQHVGREIHLSDHVAHHTLLLRLEYQLAALGALHNIGHLRHDGAAFRVGHQALWAEYARGPREERHHVRRRETPLEID